MNICEVLMIFMFAFIAIFFLFSAIGVSLIFNLSKNEKKREKISDVGLILLVIAVVSAFIGALVGISAIGISFLQQ
ncbi:MAG: hypothetical protein ACI4MQ_01695 [Candidatus Coproplasma sp.]